MAKSKQRTPQRYRVFISSLVTVYVPRIDWTTGHVDNSDLVTHITEKFIPAETIAVDGPEFAAQAMQYATDCYGKCAAVQHLGSAE